MQDAGCDERKRMDELITRRGIDQRKRLRREPAAKRVRSKSPRDDAQRPKQCARDNRQSCGSLRGWVGPRGMTGSRHGCCSDQPSSRSMAGAMDSGVSVGA